MRLGILAGPVVGGAIAVAADIRAVFIFIAVTKIFIVGHRMAPHTRDPASPVPCP